MSDTLVKFKTGTVEDLASKKVIDGVEYPSIPLESGSVYFAVDTENSNGKIVYDYPLVRTGLSNWNSTTSYAKDAEVIYNGKYYKSFVANNIGHVPYGAANSYNYWREIVTRVVMGSSYGLKLENGNLILVRDGQNTSVSLPDNNTWQANTNSQEGYVASGSGQANKVWKTDGSGNPAWRDDDNNTYSTATNTNLGLVKPWYSHTKASTGPTTGSNATAVNVNALSSTVGKYYAIESDSNGRLFVNVPWANDNTWQANTNAQAGYVTSGASQVNKVWKTDANGNPAWRDDANTTYSTATSSVLGLTKLGSDTVQSVDANAVSSETGKTYAIQLNGSSQMVVNVPWQNDNTWNKATTAQDGYISKLSGNATQYLNGKGQWSTPPNDNTTYGLSISGHTVSLVAGGTTTSVTVPDNNDNTWQANTATQEGYVSAPPTGDDGKNKVWKTDSSGVPGWRNDSNNTYSLAKYNNLGLVKPAYSSTGAATLTTAAAQNSSTPTIAAKTTDAGRYYGVEADKNGILFVNVPWTDNNTWQAATTGQVGYIPKLSGTATQYLNGAGQWTTPPNDNTTYGLSISGHTVSIVAGGTNTSVTVPDNNDNTWQLNTKNQEGYVASPNGGTNKIWMTNSTDGTPAWTAIGDVLKVGDAMVFKGVIAGTATSPGAFTKAANCGDTYRVSTAGYVNGQKVEAGDLFICTADGTVAATSSNYSTVQNTWTIAQTNLDGAVIGPASASTGNFVQFDGTSGKLISDSGYSSSSFSLVGHNHDGAYVNVTGDTMTGVLKAYANQYTDDYTTCGINMQNSDIVGLNSIYTADSADGAGEGIHFYRDSTHVDTLWMNGGDILFVPNRALGTNTSKANSQKVGRFTANPTSGQVVITDGTTGGMKSSGYTIAKSVPSDAKFTDTDTKQNITLKTTTKGYITAVETTPTGTAAAQPGIADTGVYLTTTAGQINAKTYKVDEAVTLQYNSTTKSLDFIFA